MGEGNVEGRLPTVLKTHWYDSKIDAQPAILVQAFATASKRCHRTRYTKLYFEIHPSCTVSANGQL